MGAAKWVRWSTQATKAGLVAGWLLRAGTMQGQQVTEVTGRVVATDNQERVPAAQITVPGTEIGTTASDSGTFRLRVPADARSLQIRRIGFLGRVVPLVAGQTQYTLELTRDVLHLEAQVVTGVATTVASRSAANDVSVVNTQVVNEVPAPTIENSLQGQVPGALIGQNNGGAPGGGMTVQIRGITSFYGIGSPLYVVDGVIVNNTSVNNGVNAITSASQSTPNANSQDNSPNRIADLNPDDIESVEVLKGASASSIYGSQASAGVVIITTKRGTTGKPRWQFSQKVGHFYDGQQLDLRTFPTLASAQAWGAPLGYSSTKIAALYAGPQNYQSQLFGNSQAAYETDISVSGQEAQTQYFVSGLSKYDNGIEMSTGYQKNSIRANVSQGFTSNLTASVSLFYAHDLTRRSISGNDNNGAAPYDAFSYTPQFLALNRPNAAGNYEINPYGPANPFADAALIQTPELVDRFIGGGTITWTPWSTEHQSLMLKFVGGADYTNQNNKLFAPPSLQLEQSVALPGVSETNEANTQYTDAFVNVIHHYAASDLDFTTSVGFGVERRNLNNPVSLSQDLIAGTVSPTAGVVQSNFFSESGEQDQSVYGQEQFLTLGQRLALTVGLTAERTTNDGNINKFYAYPRYSAAYRIPQFVGWLNEIKVRVAYGQSGTEPLYGVRYTPVTTLVASGLPGIVDTTTLGDRNIKPETETEFETGVDATLFQSRAQFSATLYQKRVTSLLLQGGVAPSNGFTNEWLNGGEFTNQGIELQLAATPVQLRNGFTWVSTTSFYRNYSVVNSLPVPAFRVGGFGGGFGEFFEAVGRSASEIVNSNFLTPRGIPVQVGDGQPSYVLTWSNSISYGAFSLSGLLDWQRGASISNVTNQEMDFGPLLLKDSALSARRLAAFNTGAAAYVEPGSFIKLRELALTYTVPSRWTQSIVSGRISSARLSLTGRNIWHWYASRYTGMDPEINFQSGQAVARGIELTTYPPAASYFFSLDLGL